MKNTFKVLGIIAVLTIIGFSMAACSDGDSGPNFNGTWVSDYGVSYTFSGSNVTVKNGNYTGVGTFTHTSNTITFTYPSDGYGYTIGYVLTDTYLELIRLNPNDDWFAGRFYKQK